LSQELLRIASTLQRSRFPKKFAVEICADCNLACSMCHHPTMKRPKGVMPFELWKRCADEIAVESPPTECWFSFCGEPFLEPDLLFRMLKYGAAKGLASLNVNTNGLLFTEDCIEPFFDTGAHRIVFGVDGFTAPVYERIRVKSNRDVVYSNIEKLLQARQRRASGPEIMVQFIEMPDNVYEFDAFRAHWLERGAIVKFRRMLSWGGKFDTPCDSPADLRIPCPWAVTMMHVFWDGRVPRCPGDTEGEEGSGNAWQNSLVDLWAKLGVYRELHLQYRFDELPARCHSCKDWMTGAAVRIAATTV
jgi:sulfatase maturation enzyme AslB (radical SAM superfamily)